MCFFPFPNNKSFKAKAKGVLEFTCGGCPECLAKKSRLWALRCGMEALSNVGMMITLTYDTYKVVHDRMTFEENPTDPSIPLSKRDCQLFIKRLRKHFSDKKIKYLLTAERGKRTGRAHYHALIFGVVFDDLIKYKKSDRGNWIYKSSTLEKIWKKGICTVDAINLSAKVARYCTKYCAKDSGVDDTFMLFSHGIGEQNLLKHFNGLSYWVDGREYSIPKKIWSLKIEAKYNIPGFSKYTPLLHLEDTEKSIFNELSRREKRLVHLEKSLAYWREKLAVKKDFRSLHTFRKRKTLQVFETRFEKNLKRLQRLEKEIARNKDPLFMRVKLNKLAATNISHERGRVKNELYSSFRDEDILYKRYLAYWKRKSEVFSLTQPSIEARILALPDIKYRSYKVKAMHAKHRQYKKRSFVPPRSNTTAFIQGVKPKEEKLEKSFAPLSRHYRANDTTIQPYLVEFKRLFVIRTSLRLKQAEFDVVLDRKGLNYFRKQAF